MDFNSNGAAIGGKHVSIGTNNVIPIPIRQCTCQRQQSGYQNQLYDFGIDPHIRCAQDYPRKNYGLMPCRKRISCGDFVG